jgi:FtsZ-binding cell division protein ZapB
MTIETKDLAKAEIEFLSDKCEKLENENQQLKELLYKCREKLDELDYGCEVWQGELTGFIEEIDNAIGEK